MIRLKWLELFTDYTTANLAQLLSEHRFSESSLFGFELIDVARQKIVARFVQQETITETSQDPFGEHVATTYVRYTRFDFRILKNSSRHVLCIHSPPRSLRNFLSALNRALNGDCAVGELSVDICAFIKLARINLSSKGVKVIQAVYFDVPLTNESTCKVQIASERDAISDFEAKLISGRLERATIQVGAPHATTLQFDIGRRGTLRFDESQWDDLSALDDLVLSAGL